MKNFFSLISLIVLFAFNGIAQNTLILQPDSASGKFDWICNWTPGNNENMNFSSYPSAVADAWTSGGTFYISRSLLQFDLSSISQGAVIGSATLTLYNDPTSPQNGGQQYGDNAGWLQRITSPWQYNTATWNTQPSTTPLDEVALAQSTSSNENYTVDVTSLVQDMVDSPATSYGFMLRLQTEVEYASLVFASCMNSDSMLHPKLEITYSFPPVASFQASDSSICANDCINFTDHSSNATSWFWFFPGADTYLSTEENPQNICYAAPGSYDVMLIASNAAGGDTLYMARYITVNASLTAPVITQAHDTLFCSTNTGYTSYQWYYYNSAIPGATDTFLVAAYSGNYNVKVTNMSGCSDTTGVNVILGLKELVSDSYYILFPNPVSNELTIFMTKPFHNANVEGSDLLGRRVFQQVFDAAKGNEILIDFSSVSQGAYFISTTIDGQITTRKVIKE